MSKKTDAKKNDIEIITYAGVGGAICLYFIPQYTVPVVLFSGFIGCCYGISSILKKYDDAEEAGFIEKEKIEFFKKK